MQFQYRASQDRANEMVRRLKLVSDVSIDGRKGTFRSKSVSGKIHYESHHGIFYVTVTEHTPLATETVLMKYFDNLFLEK